MAKKPLGTDSMGIQKTMRIGDYFADCGGQFALNSMSGLVSAVSYFYTDKIGVAAATAANVLLAAKICDAFTDLIMGRIMDNGKSPKGKCRPWFLRMAIPAMVVIIGLFTVPKGLTGFAQVAYLFLSNFFLTAVVSTAVSIPYTALLVMRTKSIDERNTMGIFRAAAGYLIGMIVAIALVPITNALGPNGVADQAAYIKFAVILGVLAAGMLILLYFKSKEQAEAEKKVDDGIPFTDAIKKLFHNKYWVIVLVAHLFANVIFALSSASGTYYAKWILGDDNLVGILGAVGLIPTVVGFAVVGPMTKKLGMIKTLKISMLLGIIGSVVRVIFPANFMVCLTMGCLISFSTIPMMCLGGTMNSMAMDYNDYLYGNKIVGMSASATSFGTKVASGLGASIIGWILALVSYDPNAAVLTTGVRYGIYTFCIYLPFIMLIGMFLMVCKFDLDKKYGEITAEIQARNNSTAN